MECNQSIHHQFTIEARTVELRFFSFLWPRLVPNRTKVNNQFVGVHPFRKYASETQTRRIHDERQDDFETYRSRPQPSPTTTQYESDPAAVISISIVVKPHSYRGSRTHQ